jgi:hypothetical protein
MRPLRDGQQRGHSQRHRVALALRGTRKNVRCNLGFDRRRALRFGKHGRGIVKHGLHQFDQFGLKNGSCRLHGCLLG